MSTPAMPLRDAGSIAAFFVDILERRGADAYLGEAVTMSEHMLQAARLAENAGCSEETIVAALLHDVGHFTSEFPEDAMDQGIDNRHEAAGGAVLDPYFPKAVTACVRGHVAAKRYLCATEPGYFEDLSPASVHSLELQGGPMSADEAARFESGPYFESIVAVRRFDDLGKQPGVATRPIADYAPMIERVVRRAATARAGAARNR